MSPSRERGLPVAAVAAAALTAVIAYLLDRLSAHLLRDPQAPTSVWWPPAAIAFALVVLAPRRWLPLGLAALASANVVAYEGGLTKSLFFAVANVADGALAAGIFLHLRRDRPRGSAMLHDPFDVLRLVVACVAGVALATFAVTCRAMYTGNADLGNLIRSYSTAHLVGLAVVTPAVLLAPRTLAGWWAELTAYSRNGEWLLGLFATGAVCGWLFWGDSHPTDLLLLAIPLLLCATRLDPLRAMTVVAGFCVVATVGTVRGHGVLGALANPTTRHWALQGVLGGGAVLALYVTLMAQGRRAADRRARSAERLVSQAFEAAPQPTCVTTLDADGRNEILHANQALCDLLWRTPAEMIGASSRNLVGAALAAGGGSVLQDMLAGAVDRHRFERDMVRSDGTPIPVAQDVAVVRPDDAPPYLVVTVIDLRADRAAQAVLLDALRAEADAAWSLRIAAANRKALAARTTHDLRTPLMSIQGYLDVVLDDDRLEDDQVAMLEIAQRNTARVLGLVDDLVTIAGLEGPPAQQSGSRRRASPDAVVEAALDSIFPLCARKNQRLRRPEKPCGMLVGADPAMLERAVLNVLSNATKYTPEGGEISVRVVSDGDTVSIVVADTGIGIAEADLPRVGEQFFRAGTARDQLIPGTGLGLAITRTVLERHGGEFRVASTPGIGTTVTMSLPVVARRFGPTPVRAVRTEFAS